MEVTFQLQSDDRQWASEQVQNLKKKLEHEDVDGVKVTQPRLALNPEDAGGLMDAALKILVGTDFLEKIADIIKSWIDKRADVLNAKKPVMVLDITREDGRKVSLRMENIKEAQQELENIKNLVQA